MRPAGSALVRGRPFYAIHDRLSKAVAGAREDIDAAAQRGEHAEQPAGRGGQISVRGEVVDLGVSLGPRRGFAGDDEQGIASPVCRIAIDEAQRGLHLEAPRLAACTGVDDRTDEPLDVRAGDPACAQDGGRRAGQELDDRRLDADATAAPIEHVVDRVAELLGGVLGGGRGQEAGAVGARRGSRDTRAAGAPRWSADGPEPARRRSRPPPVTIPGRASDRGTTSVRGPGQYARASASNASRTPSRFTMGSAAAASGRRTLIGWKVGRSFAAKMRATLSASRAFAPTPYTVSVGRITSPPSRSTRAASVTLGSLIAPSR